MAALAPGVRSSVWDKPGGRGGGLGVTSAVRGWGFPPHLPKGMEVWEVFVGLGVPVCLCKGGGG